MATRQAKVFQLTKEADDDLCVHHVISYFDLIWLVSPIWLLTHNTSLVTNIYCNCKPVAPSRVWWCTWAMKWTSATWSTRRPTTWPGPTRISIRWWKTSWSGSSAIFTRNTPLIWSTGANTAWWVVPSNVEIGWLQVRNRDARVLKETAVSFGETGEMKEFAGSMDDAWSWRLIEY